MRPIKPVLSVALAVALLVVSAVAVGAQSGDGMLPVHVTGEVHFDASDPVGPPTSDTSDGVVRELKGLSATRQLSLSDPRLSGSQRAVWNMFEYGVDGASVAGNLTIENDGGAWRGTYGGVVFPHGEGEARYQAMLTGEGGYEGLSAVLYYDPSSSDDSLGVEGFLFRGSMPEPPALD